MLQAINLESPKQSICVNKVANFSGCFSGSMTFWCGSGSGSADPCLGLMDPDSDPHLDPDRGIFVIDLKEANKKQFFIKFFCLVLFEVTFT